MTLTVYQQRLLGSWEDIFKQGQLTLWILLALKDSPKHMAAIQEFIQQSTDNATQVDDRSVYRSLRRYQTADLIEFTTEPSGTGPERKVYQLTNNGHAVLAAFCERNIINVFYRSAIKKLIKG